MQTLVLYTFYIPQNVSEEDAAPYLHPGQLAFGAVQPHTGKAVLIQQSKATEHIDLLSTNDLYRSI